MAIIRRLRLLWRRFSPLEERLFAAVRSVLPRPAVATFAAQVGAITHVQRLPGWTEIDYYARRAGRVDWSRVPLFPRGGEFPLARVWFVVRGRRYRATLSCVESPIVPRLASKSLRQAGRSPSGRPTRLALAAKARDQLR